jgi:hypothetical protein
MKHWAKALLGVASVALIACSSGDDDGSGGAGQMTTGGSAGTGTGGSAAGGSGGNATGGNATGGTATGGAGGSGAGGTGGAGTGGSSGGTGGDGTGGSAASGGGGTGGAGASGGAGGANAYPAGPYGKEVGDTIENYAFRGYVNDAGTALSTTMSLQDYDLDDLRSSGAGYALIHLSAYYCAGCRSAAMDLGDLSAPVQQAGGRVIEVLFDGDLDPWVVAYDLMVTTIAPQAGNTLVAGPADREHALIVDLSTMKIVWKAFGSYGATTNSSAKQGLTEMSTRLGI